MATRRLLARSSPSLPRPFSPSPSPDPARKPTPPRPPRHKPKPNRQPSLNPRKNNNGKQHSTKQRTKCAPTTQPAKPATHRAKPPPHSTSPPSSAQQATSTPTRRSKPTCTSARAGSRRRVRRSAIRWCIRSCRDLGCSSRRRFCLRVGCCGGRESFCRVWGACWRVGRRRRIGGSGEAEGGRSCWRVFFLAISIVCLACIGFVDVASFGSRRCAGVY